MSELVCIAFQAIDTADHVLNELRAMEKEYILDLEDAAVVVRDQDSKVHVKQSVNLIGAGAAQELLKGERLALCGEPCSVCSS
jgi:uncharacterized membrane protein